MKTAIEKLLADKFGGDVITRHSQVAGGADKNQILKGNPERVGLIIVNNTTNRGGIAFKAAAAAYEQIYVEANGGSIILDANDDADLPSLSIYNKYVSAAVTYYIIEIIRTNVEGDNE